MTDLTRVAHAAETLVLALVAEGIFHIDSEGRIWRMCIKKGRVVKPVLPEPRRAEYESKGYLRVRVSLQGVRLRVSAHRIVWRYFNGDIPEGCVIDHKDEVRSNNRPNNLEPVTQAVNVKRSVERRKRAVGDLSLPLFPDPNS